MEEKIESLEKLFTCRMCLEEDTLENLIEPCKCKGTQQYVHATCLRRWRRQFGHMHVHRVRCQICKTDYSVPISGYTLQQNREREEHRIIIQAEERNAEISERQLILCLHFMFHIFMLFLCLFSLMYIAFVEPQSILNSATNRSVFNGQSALYIINYAQSNLLGVMYSIYAKDIMNILLVGTLSTMSLVYKPFIIPCVNTFLCLGNLYFVFSR